MGNIFGSNPAGSNQTVSNPTGNNSLMNRIKNFSGSVTSSLQPSQPVSSNPTGSENPDIPQGGGKPKNKKKPNKKGKGKGKGKGKKK